MRDAVFMGCPKGGVLLPLQWCLVGNLIARLSGGGINIQGYADGICLLAVGKFPQCHGYCGGSFVLYRHGATRLGCWLIPTKLSSLYLQGKGNSQVSLNHTFLGLLYVTLCRSSISE